MYSSRFDPTMPTCRIHIDIPNALCLAHVRALSAEMHENSRLIHLYNHYVIRYVMLPSGALL